MIAVPDFLVLAIKHEQNLIELRQKQIEGYRKRIKLMEGGVDYDETLRSVPPVTSNLKFNKKVYLKLRTKYMNKK